MLTKTLPTIYIILLSTHTIISVAVAEDISTSDRASNSYSNLELDTNDCLQPYCFDMDFEKTHFSQLGTKSPYPRMNAEINQEVVIPNCRPVKIWMVCRHGARYMARDEYPRYEKLVTLRDDIIENYKSDSRFADEYKRCKLCDADFNLIKNWNLEKDTGERTILKPQGWNDLKNLAENYRKMYPKLFDRNYTKHNYLFHHSKETRVRYSYYAFVEGLFGNLAHFHIKPPIVPPIDLLLTPHKSCKESKNNSDTFDEVDAEPWKFEETEEFQQVIRDVSLRLGFIKPLDISEIKKIWNMCGYEQSWLGWEKGSAWCAAFIPIHFNVLNYREDLVFYYKKSYGSLINIKLTCKAVVDMLNHLEYDDTYKVVAYFVHSTFLQLFLTSINAFKDEPLYHSNYNQRHNRSFKSSESLSLAANLAAIKYKCDYEEDKVLFLLNQKPLVDLSWCVDGLCNWSDVKKKYEIFTKLNCDKTYCDPDFKGFSAAACNSVNIFIMMATGLFLVLTQF